MSGAVSVRRLKLVTNVAIRGERQPLFVKNGESGALSLVPSVYLKVSPQAMVVSSTKAGL